MGLNPSNPNFNSLFAKYWIMVGMWKGGGNPVEEAAKRG